MNNTVKAKIEFMSGDVINLELYPDEAPITVANFVKLCNAGFYDGLCFHRVIDGFMIQGGGFVYDPRKGLIQKNAETIKGEFASNGVNNTVSHKLGVISMARTPDKNSASSQFFICVADVPYLDRDYAAFGKCATRRVSNRCQTRQSKDGQMAAFLGRFRSIR